eukprot:m.70012 g.70012  ORF g.70012 m.70012 type:complete len:460 (-) comp8295_c1_seq4:139-1518(-)
MSLHDHVVMAGYLEKSPPIGKGSILKGVKRRWFVLRSDTAQFSYYVDTDTKKPPKGEINMADVVKVEGYQKWPLGKKEKHPWVFTIENVKGRVFFLSTGTEESMKKWVSKLSQTFEDFLSHNNDTIATRESRTLSFSDGVVTVDLSLVEGLTLPEMSVQIDDRTSQYDLLVLLCKKNDLDYQNYALVVVDATQLFFQCASTMSDPPLALLRKHNSRKLYLIHKDEVPITLPLIKAQQEQAVEKSCEQLYSDIFEGQRFEVKYIGCETTQLKEEGSAGLVSREKLQKHIEHMKKNSSQEVKLEVSQNGIRVWRPTPSPKRPYSIVVEHSLFTVLDCFNFEKVFAYLMLVNNGELSLQRLYAFKCADKAMATKIRLLARSHCQSTFHALQKNADFVADRALNYGLGFEFQMDARKVATSNDPKTVVLSMSEKASLDILLKMSGSSEEFTSMADLKGIIDSM